jgi:hypothetical protein
VEPRSCYRIMDKERVNEVVPFATDTIDKSYCFCSLLYNFIVIKNILGVLSVPSRIGGWRLRLLSDLL